MAPRATQGTTKKPAKAKKGKSNGVGKTKGKKAKAAKSVKKPKEAKEAKSKGKAKKVKKPPKRVKGGGKKARRWGDPLLFAPLSEGERADALRIMTEDRRLAQMAAVGRYRVIAVEPLVVKEPHDLAGHRLARVVAYDYSADRSVHACVDLDTLHIAHLQLGPIQPMLALEEEAAAIGIALGDDRVQSQLGLGDQPRAALHYWSTREADISYRRRSAAVLFGQPDRRPSLVAVIDLLDSRVVDVVPADQW